MKINDFGERKGGGSSVVAEQIDSRLGLEDGADHDNLKTTTKSRIRNYLDRLVDYHVRKQEGDEEEVTILPVRFSRYSASVRCEEWPSRRVREDVGIVMRWHSRCPADAQHVQLGLIRTDVSQSQPSEYSERGEEGGYETSANGLSHGELFTFRKVLGAGVGSIMYHSELGSNKNPAKERRRILVVGSKKRFDRMRAVHTQQTFHRSQYLVSYTFLRPLNGHVHLRWKGFVAVTACLRPQ